MPFTSKVWVDSPATSTPITAAALVDVETRLSAYTDTVATAIVIQPGATSGTLVQAAITTLKAGRGGDVVLAPGTHTWDVVPSFPRTMADRIRVCGEHGAKIVLSAGAPRAFDFNRVTDYDVFQNITLEDLVIDCNQIGGQSHVVIGTYIAGFQARLNFDTIQIRRVTVLNAPTNGNVNVDHRLGIAIISQHTSVNEATQTYVKNILVEDFVMDGNGNAGVIVSGGGPVGGVNVLVDNIVFDRCRHSLAKAFITGGAIGLPTGTLTVDSTTNFASSGQLRCQNTTGAIQTVTYTGKSGTTFTGCTGGTGTLANGAPLGFPQTSNFQMGGRGIGGKGVMRDCFGANSGDNGVETNAMTTMLHDNCHMADNLNLGFYQTNYQTPLAPLEQRVTYRDCTYRIADPTISVGWGVGPSTVSTLNSIKWQGCRLFVLADPTFGNGGAAISAVGADNVREFIVDDFKVDRTVAATLSATTAPSEFWFASDIACKLTMRGIDVRVSGVLTPGAFNAAYRALNLSGFNTHFLIDDFRFDFNVTGQVSATTRCMILGADASSVIRGLVRKLTVTQFAGDANPRAVRVSSNWTPDAAHTVTFTDCDFSGMSAGAEFLFDTAGTKAYVYFNNIRWMTFPLVVSSMSPGASPYLYQNLDGYREMVLVQGGTVSKVEYSRTGSAFHDTGVIAGAFQIDNGDYLRVTYSVVPNMTKYPTR